MRCCTLYSRRDGLHSVNALTVISEHGGKHLRRTRERSPRTTEMLRGSANLWLGRHHGDGRARLPAQDGFGLYRLRASSRLSGGRDFIILC